MKICVVGLGKIGLPLAVHFAKMGNEVTGSDINDKTVSMINDGLEPFPEEENLQNFLTEVVDNGSLVATTDNEAAVSISDVVIVVVPLFVDENAKPDFVAMDAVTKDIAMSMKPGTLVSYETTVPIGTTRDRFLPVLENLSGLVAGRDFNLVFSPERVLTGRVFSDLRKYPKIVGGITEKCTKRGVEFYSKTIVFDPREDLSQPNGVWPLESSEAAEFVKLAETTYRDVNIGLANQFSEFARKKKLDIHQIISAANSQPYSHIHTPGISVGGHCIPIYPQFYMWNDRDASIVSAARSLNASMPSNAIQLLKQRAGSLAEKKVALLGISYRPGVKETAFSGSLDLLKLLKKEKAEVYASDPLYSREEIIELGFKVLLDTADIDIIILHTAHLEFKEIDFAKFSSLKYVLDGRNFINAPTDLNHLEFIKL